MQRTIELDETQLAELERLAEQEHTTVEELLRVAIHNYLVQQRQDWSDWAERFGALVDRVQSRIPADVTPEEIEADITAARAEVRAERTAQRSARRR
jgi:hypothetical protein